MKLLNTALAAATIGAMAHTESLDISSLKNHEASNQDEGIATTLTKTPSVKHVINSNFNSLIKNIQKEGVSLADMYASSNPQSSGSSDILMSNYKTGTQNVGGSGRSITNSEIQFICHSQCHSQCHNNHSSRGWR